LYDDVGIITKRALNVKKALFDGGGSGKKLPRKPHSFGTAGRMNRTTRVESPAPFVNPQLPDILFNGWSAWKITT
jgi:hypothetical protein